MVNFNRSIPKRPNFNKLTIPVWPEVEGRPEAEGRERGEGRRERGGGDPETQAVVTRRARG